MKRFSDRETFYEKDRIITRGKIHWSDEEFVVISCYYLKDAIESDVELPRWVWEYFVKVRDNYTCVKCGFKQDRMKSVCAHHIVYTRNHQEEGKHVMSNGETQCWSCHSKGHDNMRGNHNKHIRNTKRWKNASYEEQCKLLGDVPNQV